MKNIGIISVVIVSILILLSQISWLNILVVKIILKAIFLLIAIAFYTLAERKIMAAVQRRLGPKVVGVVGLLQPLADGLKLVIKELIIPMRANKLLYVLAPVVFLVLSFSAWSLLPFNSINVDRNILSFSDFKYTILVILAISSLNVYPLIFGGWASNSKYAFLGGLRSAAQMISYEVSIGLLLLPIILLTESFNITTIVLWQKENGWLCIPLFLNMILVFISFLAETNRAPFDLPEAEGELVAGYNVEYASISFAMFFLAEYSNMLLMSTLMALLFLGGWSPFELSLFIKIILFTYLFVLIRAAFPRYRYDQLMNLGWKVFLPISLGLCLIIASLITGLTLY